MTANRPTRAEIDLQALLHNYREAQRLAGPERDVLAVVKADAYGHGAVAVARSLEAAGARRFGVALVEEGVELRRAGLQGEIMVFGAVFPGQEGAVLEHRLIPFLFDLDAARRLQQAARAAGRKLPVHLKLDTGMGRVGFLAGELAEVLAELKELAALDVQGVVSHLALADDLASPVTAAQRDLFRALIGQVEAAGFRPRWRHISNSAGLVGPELAECNLVRQGISLYGGQPGEGFAERMELLPVLTLKTAIAQLRQLPAGCGVSYGHRFVTSRPTTLAVLPVGYADGYNRLFTNRGAVLIGGRRAPIAGTVCMDWVLVDVTDLPGVAAGDEVVLLGGQGEARISAEEWADLLGTINYEVFCRIGARVPRVYV